ncbi:hypothetical protein GCM10027051_02480 [Niabella terrae]
MAVVVMAICSCSKDADPIIVVPPSSGATLTLNGLEGNEDPASAANTVFVDFSADQQTAVKRSGWDLGFYNGASFKVIINSTMGASAVAVDKTDINAVTEADFNPDTLALGHGMGSFSVIDDPRESSILSKTVIQEVSATEGENKVYILNRVGGTGATLPAAELYKIRILRSGNGYSLQYAPLTATSFQTLEISKTDNFNFGYVSLVSGTVVMAEPEQDAWEIAWGVNTYTAGPTIPYIYSDFIVINNLAGVTALERIYADQAAAEAAYNQFNKDSVAKYSFKDNRLVIAGNWRATTGTKGVRKDRFYLVKDAVGNVYKLKFISFIAEDGGTRGKPQLTYTLID